MIFIFQAALCKLSAIVLINPTFTNYFYLSPNGEVEEKISSSKFQNLKI